METEKIQEFMEKVEKGLTDFTLEQVKQAQSVLKLAELKLMENQEKGKNKAIVVSEDIHAVIKEHCRKSGVKIGQWAEDLFKKELGIS